MTENTPGVTVGQIVRPLESVGCYVPGGRYPLPSTLLMTTIPAKVAGVTRIVVCSPKPARETLAAAHLAGITEMYRTGGAQAIAAMAYGTETIARVDKIVGPGNLYVTAAKVIASTECGIDMPAGPTEIVVTSEIGNAAGIAADLVAQAEHDPETLAVFVTADSQLAKLVINETKSQMKDNKLAKTSLKARGTVFLCGSVEETHTITNRLAPEHLTVDTVADLEWVTNAGSVFIGNHSPQSMGDYISGPNHVLPTGRVGRMRGGLSVNDFLKVITVQNYTAAGLETLGPKAIALAEAEGLTAHAESVRVRMKAGRALSEVTAESGAPRLDSETWDQAASTTAPRHPQHAGVSPAARRSHCASPRLQREHARTLAARTRSTRKADARKLHDLPRTRPRRSHRRPASRSAAGAGAAHQRRR